MPSYVVETVKSSGGDFTTITLAESGQSENYVTADKQVDIELYASGSSTGSATLTFDGGTYDATRYPRYIVPLAERHSGAWDAAKYYYETHSVGAGIYINDAYIRFEGVQFDGQPCPGQVFYFTTGANNCLLTKCIVRGGGTSSNAVFCCIDAKDGTHTAINCLFYGNAQNSGIYTRGATFAFKNCTSVDHADYGFRYGSGTLTLENCYSGGNGIEDYTGTITRTTCAHSSATSFSGSTASIAFSTANFVNVTGGSEDLHLVSGASSTLHTGGTDLSGTFTDDIDGDTRTSWGIGADFYYVAPPPSTGTIIINVGLQSGGSLNYTILTGGRL